MFILILYNRKLKTLYPFDCKMQNCKPLTRNLRESELKIEEEVDFFLNANHQLELIIYIIRKYKNQYHLP